MTVTIVKKLKEYFAIAFGFNSLINTYIFCVYKFFYQTNFLFVFRINHVSENTLGLLLHYRTHYVADSLINKIFLYVYNKIHCYKIKKNNILKVILFKIFPQNFLIVNKKNMYYFLKKRLKRLIKKIPNINMHLIKSFVLNFYINYTN